MAEDVFEGLFLRVLTAANGRGVRVMIIRL